MNEDFLHYVWKYQKFDTANLTTVTDEKVQVIVSGQHNFNSGPDFYNGQIYLEGQLWAGNIEIHLKSSDWYAHNHQEDSAYDNVILHVVWEHDVDVFRKDSSIIPTLVLKPLVSEAVLSGYHKLFSKQQKWINCENDFPKVDTFIIENWLERLFFERLEKKQIFILTELERNQNHWEALLFSMLCKNFGLKVNGESFTSIAASLDFSVIKKCGQNQKDIESILFGQAQFFQEEKEDSYFNELKKNYSFLKNKFSLVNENVIQPKFFRLRPPGFPTIRLSQLSVLYSEKQNLFSEVISITDMSGYYNLFKVAASSYWDTHYNFGITSAKNKKSLTKDFIDLLIINTIIPLKFAYAHFLGKDNTDEILQLASQISSEKNSIVKKFDELNPISENAAYSQALIQLKSEYCDKNNCLQCAIGNSIIKG